MARLLHERHKFLVEAFARFASAAFQKCSELKVTAAKIEYYEGGTVIPFKDAGRLTYSDVTLDRGTSQDTALHTWFQDVQDASVGVPGSTGFGSGDILPEFKSPVGIIQMDRDNSRLVEYTLNEAFPIDLVAGAWDNTVDEVVIESLTLTYDYFERANQG